MSIMEEKNKQGKGTQSARCCAEDATVHRGPGEGSGEGEVQLKSRGKEERSPWHGGEGFPSEVRAGEKP